MVVATLSDLAGWLACVSTRRWSWHRNSRAKYVTLKIDTRSGAYKILDRDENEITLEQLEFQIGRDQPPPTSYLDDRVRDDLLPPCDSPKDALIKEFVSVLEEAKTIYVDDCFGRGDDQFKERISDLLKRAESVVS